MTRFWKPASTALLLLVACSGGGKIEGEARKWLDGNRVQIGVESDGAPTGDWDFTIHSEGDVYIRGRSAAPQDVDTHLVLLDDRYFLYMGGELERGYEIDALDAPVLMLQLAFNLLARIYPGGPQSVPRTDSFRRIGMRSIELSTAAASAYFPPPWTVTGTAEANGIITFELTFRTGLRRDTFRLRGSWAKEDIPERLENSQ
ncbi:MAG: hypothetical protein WBG64_05850, partial [Thermoanaerobaculia bacterium]